MAKQDERRVYKRIDKNFILTYYDKADPSRKYELTQLKNISMGGMCFITTQAYVPSSKMGIELKTPYLADTTHLEGNVLASHEKVKNIIYETRIKFDLLSSESEFLLAKLIEFFTKSQGKNNG
ncbi:hypothetical protein MNBD_BACTEROID05-679 [hydrothermal vent metagenome]|uniref:PilZ domain-containing protein n=1 Tax=hydrothermal vent metagenome TaxID=652676 RepID=A0A3B0TLF9_9ZZZZ